ncbi:hypothetical protein A5893_11135 [Pedobacter psychrophilus]|uniref:Uncharacterized protein n=1 Tax=Pedobacter psychrophilus TaxID=1826909 RepID=A0A179DFG6_9SPHI|nr:hypothetical protein [Pedobacter psychrophilus]OAQ39213.1 hypothetical protein A5893_11135 [Pedobacter psychrophilus]
MSHTFHIPVLGLGYSIDTPLNVAPYGISSVISVVDDIAIERVRKHHSEKNNRFYEEISNKEDDYRAKRITAYLNLLKDLVDEKFESFKKQSFENGIELTRYFDLLPKTSPLKRKYLLMLAEKNIAIKSIFIDELKKQMVKGNIDVNIMSKVDKMNVDANGDLKEEIFSDALAALRGFANSNLTSSLILSAGMNPRLYSYLERFKDFLPDENLVFKKKLILKVSDYRSALIQAKFLAKKGIWVSEFRIESGLNCGGHAFATEGYLLGPILEEFKQKRQEMIIELFAMYKKALSEKNIFIRLAPKQKITLQGGIGTFEEDNFLRSFYHLDATGWGSPFLLVPEVTAVDEETLKDLSTATAKDFYVSASSPLGIPFNNFRKSGSEKQRLQRIADGKPGSPCTKKYLVSNTEFTAQPICTASKKYQGLKIKDLQNQQLEENLYQQKYDEVTSKICLCEGLVSSAYLKYDIFKSKESKAVAICPGPNLAFFNGIYTLEQMVGHIYGKLDLIKTERPHIFINELKLYIDYLKNDINSNILELTAKKEKSIKNFHQQLNNGIQYYKTIADMVFEKAATLKSEFLEELSLLERKLDKMGLPVVG